MSTEETTKSENTSKPEVEEKKAVVDTFFDLVTAETARGLGVFARWLDALAKRLHEVATKLETKPNAAVAAAAAAASTKVEEPAAAK